MASSGHWLTSWTQSEKNIMDTASRVPDSPVIVQAGIADGDILMGADEATAEDDVVAVEAACARQSKACVVM